MNEFATSVSSELEDSKKVQADLISKIISGLHEFSENHSKFIDETKKREQEGLELVKSAVEEISIKAAEADEAMKKVFFRNILQSTDPIGGNPIGGILSFSGKIYTDPIGGTSKMIKCPIFCTLW